MTQTHRYSSAALTSDYLRAGIGLALTLLPILALEVHPVVFWFLSVCALLFLWFLSRTILRQTSWIESGPEGVTVHGLFSRRLAWPALRGLRLRYFSTRRDRREGWMTMKLSGPEGVIHAESTLSDFEDLVEKAAKAAIANNLALNQTTEENLVALGIDMPDRDEA